MAPALASTVLPHFPAPRWGAAPRRYPAAVIYLLRHGEAEDGNGKPDADRELTEKGKRQAEEAGAALAALGEKIDACLSSPKVRSAETARIACRHLGLEVELTEGLRGGPFDSSELAAGRSNVLLVGHEPDFSEEVARLTGANVKLRKGGIAAVDGSLLHLLMRPRDLRRIGHEVPPAT
jgi:phosphohistidine phosphatase